MDNNTLTGDDEMSLDMLILLNSPMFLFHSGSNPSIRFFMFIFKYTRAFLSFLLLVSRKAVAKMT